MASPRLRTRRTSSTKHWFLLLGVKDRRFLHSRQRAAPHSPVVRAASCGFRWVRYLLSDLLAGCTRRRREFDRFRAEIRMFRSLTYFFLLMIWGSDTDLFLFLLAKKEIKRAIGVLARPL